MEYLAPATCQPAANLPILSYLSSETKRQRFSTTSYEETARLALLAGAAKLFRVGDWLVPPPCVANHVPCCRPNARLGSGTTKTERG